MKKALAVVVATLGMMAGLTGCTTIEPGYTGIKISKLGPNRGVQDLQIVNGFVGYNPMSTEIVSYPTFMQTVKWTASSTEGKPVDESITFTSGDSLTINADVSLSYELASSEVPNFYVKFRADNIDAFTDGYLRNVVRNAFNEAAGKYTVEQLMGDNAQMLKDAATIVQGQVSKYGVKIDQLGFIGAPRPPQSVIAAINGKVQAQQIALQKQNEVAQATADAQKAVALAAGQAEANQKLTSSLSPALIEWRKLDIEQQQVNKWNGVLPHVQSGNGGGLLLNVQ
jgi:regulator of protease activity HflC (stomatin/prohibitin superfamily)